jgi:hypothetical protein
MKSLLNFNSATHVNKRENISNLFVEIINIPIERAAPNHRKEIN